MTGYRASSLGGPVYKEIKQALLKRMADGAWAPGEAIPSEARLKEEFGVAIGTIRKAVDELVGQNLLIRQQGRGTFVATHDRDRLLFHFFHVERRDGYKEYPEVRLMSFARERADRPAAQKLGIYEGDRVFRFTNVLSLEGRAVMFDDIVLPEALFPRLTEKRLRERPGTLYMLYQDDYAISVVRTAQRLSAATALREVARALDLPAGLPTLVIDRVAYAYHDRPVEYRVSHVDTRGHDYVAGTER
jgi:GntR family transcriptional regulator